jgi:class 3 adenylate cyclase
MISRALAALALGGLLFIILPGCFQTGEASQSQTVSSEIIERYQQTLSMGIGVNTGPVVAGNIGSATKMEYTVIDEEFNIAARMQGIAQPGEVLISENTYRIVAEAVHVTRLEPITFKGKNTMVGVYRVDGQRENE